MSEHDTAKKPASDFEAAQAIVDILRRRDKAEQERILRWVSESLQIASSPTHLNLEASSGTGQAPPVQPPRDQTPTGGQRTNIQTFVAEKQPKSDVQFAAVTAYYYRFEADGAERKDAIGSDDLQDAARLAGWDRFPKPYVPLQNAANQGYLDRASRGTFRINAVGENLVAMTLPGGKDQNSAPSTRGKRRTGKSRRRMKRNRGRSAKSN